MVDGAVVPLELPLELIEPPVGWVLAGLWGALWGSFFNVAVARLGREDARLSMVVHPPSRCPRCNAAIAAYDNVPILAWLWLRGRCRRCREPISVRYPLVEAASLLLALAVYARFVLGHPDDPVLEVCRFLLYFHFAGTLLVLALIDFDTGLIPHAITLPSIAFFGLAARVIGDVPWSDALIGLAVGFLGMQGIAIGYALLRKREGLGGGDATLMGLVGVFLGWRALPFALGLGSNLGVLAVLPLLLYRRVRAPQPPPAAMQQPADPPSENASAAPPEEPGELGAVEVRFGPFLVAGALLYLFFHDAAWAWMMDRLDEQ